MVFHHPWIKLKQCVGILYWARFPPSSLLSSVHGVERKCFHVFCPSKTVSPTMSLVPWIPDIFLVNMIKLRCNALSTRTRVFESIPTSSHGYYLVSRFVNDSNLYLRRLLGKARRVSLAVPSSPLHLPLLLASFFRLRRPGPGSQDCFDADSTNLVRMSIT